MEKLGLYIHIPFCKSKCFYCDFNSYSGKDYLQERYVDSLIAELKFREPIIEKSGISTIYIGGGTPTYLNNIAFKKLFSYLKRYYRSGVEYSCEANPGTLNKEKLSILKENGVNRLSIGLQSWNDDILKRLGRIHNVYDFIENYDSARKIGFDNINVDIMFSIQGQTMSDFENTLDNVCNMNPEHISCYGLIIEDGTLFGERYKNGELKEVDEDTDRAMYYTAVEKLRKAGYLRYEISNFAKSNYECRHNIIYWDTRHYLGIGAGAHSYIGDVRFSNVTAPEKYIRLIENYKLPVADEEHLTTDDMMSEFMFMGLRMTKGVQFSDFKNRFGLDMENVYGKQIEKLQKYGLVKVNGNSLSLTDRGIDISNAVFVEFIR